MNIRFTKVRLTGGRSYGLDVDGLLWIKEVDRWKKLDVQPPASVNDFDVVEGPGRHGISRDQFVVLAADGHVFVDRQDENCQRVWVER